MLVGAKCMRPPFVRIIALILSLLASADRAQAIGWDSDDFLIGGGPSFTDRIGVFDHDLTFKGLLDAFFPTVAGMDFDAEGRLVAVAGAVRSVRVYEPTTGAIVGGFTRQDNLLGTPGDLKVAPDGSYVIATRDVARQFTPSGVLIREFAPSNSDGLAVVPGNRLWSSGPHQPVFIYDLTSGASVGSFSAPGGFGGQSMSYSETTDTVLLLQRGQASIHEMGLDGQVIRTFIDPVGRGMTGITRGPSGDVFATTTAIGQPLLRWGADGSFVGATSTGFGGWVVWAGNVPEPSGCFLAIAIVWLAMLRRP
jgi:hypothetical protein